MTHSDRWKQCSFGPMTIVAPRMPKPKKGWPKGHDKGTLGYLGPRHGGPGPMRNNHRMMKGQDTMVWGPTHGCMGPHGILKWTLGYPSILWTITNTSQTSWVIIWQ